CAGNGSPFSSIATQYPGLSRLPFGRDAKRSSALLRALERGEAIPGGTRLAANRLASRYNRQFV
ncbi:MAG: hypothetical protein P8179_15855, partial [Candidatus Thiodiazotropha sp.]